MGSSGLEQSLLAFLAALVGATATVLVMQAWIITVRGVIRRPPSEFHRGPKRLWVLVVLLAGPPGAIAYLALFRFTARRPLDRFSKRVLYTMVIIPPLTVVVELALVMAPGIGQGHLIVHGGIVPGN